MLAESCLWGAFWGSADPREAFPRAKSAALEALRLDDTVAEAHSALACVLGCGEFDWPGAERGFLHALELNPSTAASRFEYATWFLQPLGRAEQALTEMRRAVELDPLDPFYNTQLGYCLHAARQFDLAEAQLRHAIDLDPTFFESYWFLAVTCMRGGRQHEAVAAAEKANEISGGHSLTLGMLGRAYGLAGRTAEARLLLEELEARRRSGYVPPSSISMIHRGLGDPQKGLEWWARGVEERDPVVVMSLKSEPAFDPLRSHPTYHALLRKMNLEP